MMTTYTDITTINNSSISLKNDILFVIASSPHGCIHSARKNRDCTKNKRFQRTVHAALIGCIFLLAMCFHAEAQMKPPRPISVYTAQGVSFGAFSQGSSGGSVVISASGSRSATGSVSLIGMGFSYHSAIFEVDANQGTLISIVNGADATLTGSNGGSITLHVGSSLPASPFITNAVPPTRNQIYIGATLYVGNPLAAPAGAYSGSFSVTFMLN